MSKAIRQRKLLAMGEHPDTGGREGRTTPIPSYAEGGLVNGRPKSKLTQHHGATEPSAGLVTPAYRKGGRVKGTPASGVHPKPPQKTIGRVRSFKRGGSTGFSNH